MTHHCATERAPYSMLARGIEALLDRIDEIVPPGIDINPADGGWADPALQPPARRRQHPPGVGDLP